MINKCAYSGLTGIILDELPSMEVIKETSHENWQKIIKNYAGKDNPAIASIFWDIGELLPYSRIHDLGTGSHYAPTFNEENGVFVPSMPLCGGIAISGIGLSEDVQRQAAMRELLTQSLDYLHDERDGRYFMLTPYKKGCCSFKGGIIETKTKEIIEMLRYI